MSVASEITRLQNAKASLKSSINAKTDAQHQITNETIDNYSDFVDSIQTGGGTSYPPDWTQIGYNDTPQSVIDDFNYSKQIKDEWIDTTNLSYHFANDTNLVYMPVVDTSNVTNMRNMFNPCVNLTTLPLLNTSNVTNMNYMFSGCTEIKVIPPFNTENLTTMQYMFSGCTNLTTIPVFNTAKVTTMRGAFSTANYTDTTLDNILKMCIGTTNEYTRSKTLNEIGFNSGNYPASRIQALPHYQDFITAGWTIGY